MTSWFSSKPVAASDAAASAHPANTPNALPKRPKTKYRVNETSWAEMVESKRDSPSMS